MEAKHFNEGPLGGRPIIRIDDLVEWRADGGMMVDFFRSLYRHCSSGFLHYRAFPYFLNDPGRRLFFDISKSFKELPAVIEAHQEEGFWEGSFRCEYFFDLNLYGTPRHKENDVETVVAVWLDADNAFDQKILEKIPPSMIVKTRDARCSPRGVDHFNFYWILREPVRPSLDYLKVLMRLYKLFFDKRFWYVCTGYQMHARIPGTLNFWQKRVTFEESGVEYEFDFFDNFLPRLGIADALHYANAYRKMFSEEWRGIVG